LRLISVADEKGAVIKSIFKPFFTGGKLMKCPDCEYENPEDIYTIMDQVYEILIHKVHDYGGTVNEFTGDGIMALFGAPLALEDAPQRAIRSAYAIHREMTKLSEKIFCVIDEMPPIKMRIGFHSGPVVVGTLGNDL
jgi:class 3 adenylate cyclase